MEHLIAGYREFSRQRWPAQRTLYEELSKAQQPDTMIISCCDSRVDPATIFSARPGELFIVRNVANLVPPFERDGSYHGTSAALEFAVRKLRVSTILVLGHGQCGGVAAALAPPEESSLFLTAWIDLLRPVVQSCSLEAGDMAAACERESVRISMNRLMSFPFIADAVQEGTLRLEGAHFAIADGKLEWLQPDGAFHVVV
jgi:carbonic anhydrase